MPSLSTTLGKIKLKNPLILASGILGVTASSLKNIERNGAGAVTFKSLGPLPRKGHPNPTVITYEHGMLNAVGLSNPGLDACEEEIKKAQKILKIPLIINIFGDTMENFGVAAKKCAKFKPQIVEANISCPNVHNEFGLPFSLEPETASIAIKQVKKYVKCPLIAKLSPNTYKLKAVAKAVVKAGADIINMGNTCGPGMAIDLKTAKPILHNKMGGVSGPGIKPIMVRCVYDIYSAVKVPIIGTGGVTTGKDAIEMFMAGASAVGIGTAIYYRGPSAFKKINEEILEFMRENGYGNIKEMIGRAHVD